MLNLKIEDEEKLPTYSLLYWKVYSFPDATEAQGYSPTVNLKDERRRLRV